MASSARSQCLSTCEVCDLTTTHLHKHTLRTHVPWYVSPSTAWVDCHKSEGFGKDCDRFYKGHMLISGDNLLRAWSLLMNGLFLFVSKEHGLNSCTDLLTYDAAQHLPKKTQDLGRGVLSFSSVGFESAIGTFSYWWLHEIATYTALQYCTSSCHDCTVGQIHCSELYCFYNICLVSAIWWLLTFPWISLDENWIQLFSLSSGQVFKSLGHVFVGAWELGEWHWNSPALCHS